MERLRHEARSDENRRSTRPLEYYSPRERLKLEKKYKLDPAGFRSRLIYSGYWRIAAQLKTDFEAGRL